MTQGTRLTQSSCQRLLGIAVALVMVRAAAHGQSIEHVIQISVDGLHAGQLLSLLQTEPDRFPNFRRFVSEGSTTFDARIDQFSPFTLPNHTSMLTGRPVLQPADDPTLHHGYTNNSDPPKDATLHNSGNPAVAYVASTFDVAHDHGLSTALYTGKDKFIIYQQSYNATAMTPGGRGDTFLENGDQGRNKIDKYEFEVVSNTSSGIMETLVADFAADPFNYTFLHLLEPDAVGHAWGWRSQEWNEIVELVDGELGQLFTMIQSNSRLADRTALILTADHGGSLLGHDDPQDPNMFRVPFFVWGPSVSPGTDLYELNLLTRSNPSDRQTTYLDTLQPVRNSDSGNLALALLGLPPIDGSTINARQDLRVQLPVVARWDGSSELAGVAGNGTDWNDRRNWTRTSNVDRAPIAGDIIQLPNLDLAQSLSLTDDLRIQSLHVAGEYDLGNASIRLLTGEVDVDESGSLSLAGDLDSPQGIIKNGSGTLRLREGRITELLLAEGRVEGNLTVQGDALNRGLLAPGIGLGEIQVQGDLTQAAAGVLEFELWTDGQSDRISVEGRLNNRGTLSLLPGEVAADPVDHGTFQRWTLLTFARQIGRFWNVRYDNQVTPLSFETSSFHAGGGLFRIVEYGTRQIAFVNYRAIEGDANGDGAFDTQDLVAVFAAGGYENGTGADADWTTGDWDLDQDFTSSDLVAAFAAGAFEQPSLLSDPSAPVVPEPQGMGALWMAFVAARLLACPRRARINSTVSASANPLGSAS